MRLRYLMYHITSNKQEPHREDKLYLDVMYPFLYRAIESHVQKIELPPFLFWKHTCSQLCSFNPLTPVCTLFSHRNNIVLVVVSSTVRRQRVNCAMTFESMTIKIISNTPSKHMLHICLWVLRYKLNDYI